MMNRNRMVFALLINISATACGTQADLATEDNELGQTGAILVRPVYPCGHALLRS